MKKKIILTIVFCIILVLITIFCLSLPKKDKEIDINNLNEGINSLLQDIPNDDLNIEVEINSSSNSYEDYNPEDTFENFEDKKYQEEAQEFSDYLLNSSEDIIPKELNFSFYSISSNVPEKINYYGCEFTVEPVDFISTEISLINPSLYMTTVFPFYNDEEKAKYSEYYKNLMKGIIDDYGTIIAGNNYSTFEIVDIKEGFTGGMIFEFSDCFVLVQTLFVDDTFVKNDKDETMKAITVTIGYISKNEYHVFEGPEYTSLKYIESFITPNFKYYYYDADGKGFILNKDSIANKNLSMKY